MIIYMVMVIPVSNYPSTSSLWFGSKELKISRPPTPISQILDSLPHEIMPPYLHSLHYNFPKTLFLWVIILFFSISQKISPSLSLSLSLSVAFLQFNFKKVTTQPYRENSSYFPHYLTAWIWTYQVLILIACTLYLMVVVEYWLKLLSNCKYYYY